MYLFQKIEEMTIQYSDSRKKIGEFLLTNQDQIDDLTMEETAQKTHSSKSSLVRFAKSLGFSGWTDFIRELKQEIANEKDYLAQVDPNVPFEESDGFEVVAQKISILLSESLSDTASRLDGSTLFRAASILDKADHILIFCISPYLYLAELFRRKMLSIGKQVTVVETSESSMEAQRLSENDCAIMISYSGNNETLKPISQIREIKEKGAKLIALTSAGDNTLRNSADVTLTISSRERLFSKIATFATEESINYLLNVLFSSYFKMNFKENLEYKISVSKQIEENKRYTNIKDIQD